MNKIYVLYKYENTTTYNTACLISSYPSDNVSHKTNKNVGDSVR